MSSRSTRSIGVVCSFAWFALFPGSALAEKTLLKTNDWEVYTDGRVGAFLTYARGDGLPQPARDAAGNQIHDISGPGGLNGQAER